MGTSDYVDLEWTQTQTPPTEPGLYRAIRKLGEHKHEEWIELGKWGWMMMGSEDTYFPEEWLAWLGPLPVPPAPEAAK